MATILNPEATLSEKVLSHYPAPIAQAWRHVRRSFTKKEEHDRLLDLLEDILGHLIATGQDRRIGSVQAGHGLAQQSRRQHPPVARASCP